MNQAIPYLIFSGNCREALEFYTQCWQGEITTLQTVGESPMTVPEEHRARIFDSEFQSELVRFKASDDMPGQPSKAGANFAIFVPFKDDAHQKQVYNLLSEEGQVQYPLENNFGMVVDKYQVQWMLAKH